MKSISSSINTSAVCKRVLAFLMSVITMIFPFFFPVEQEPLIEIEGSLLPVESSTFENDTTLASTNWTVFGSAESAVTPDGRNGGSCFSVDNRATQWSSPAINLYDFISQNGAGHYKIGMWLRLTGSGDDFDAVNNFGVLIRGRDGGADKNSFLSAESDGIQYYSRLSYITGSHKSNEWFYFERCIHVSPSDLDGTLHQWLLCFDLLNTAAAKISVDDAVLVKLTDEDAITQESFPEETQKWLATEFVLLSDKSYDNPLFDTETEIKLTHSQSGKTLTVPGFWDGDNVWKFRFALTEQGEWKYETFCTDSENLSLNGRSGVIGCAEYTGELEIYRRGFVKTTENVKYFMYDDGTPFFYLGDTHWNMPAEELYIAGERANGIETDSHFKYIVDRRVQQGFTVYQSEPISAAYNLSDGLNDKDIYGFRDMDERFAYIASRGLVHANAELFFSSELSTKSECYSDEYLEKLSRYWAARYSAYPVLWTTAQECDDDFYYDADGSQNVFTAQTNPWKKVLENVTSYDAYSHPGSGHQEFASMSGANASGGVNATSSAFRDVPGHTWYAAQWSPVLNRSQDFEIPKDFWYNSQGKPAINYEGRYENLWTKNFGARAQGWISYLNGLYGYGYGAEDIWLYCSTYDIDKESYDKIEKITVEDKQVHWGESVNFETADQLGGMREFFEQNDWSTLIPRFDDENYSSFSSDLCYSLASNANERYVAYFYGKSIFISGFINGLDDEDYVMEWYNPRDNSYRGKKTINPLCGRHFISCKPDRNDWVLLIYKEK